MAHKPRFPTAPAPANTAKPATEDEKVDDLDPDTVVYHVTEENVADLIANAPKPKRSEILKLAADPWPVCTVAHRLRESVNFLHAHGLISDALAISFKEQIDEQERS